VSKDAIRKTERPVDPRVEKIAQMGSMTFPGPMAMGPPPVQPQAVPIVPPELLEWGRGVRDDVAAIRKALTRTDDPLETIRSAHVEYEAALARHEHGAVAADRFICAVAKVLAGEG